MCKYCDCNTVGIGELNYGYGIESETSNSVFAHIGKDPNENIFYFEINETFYAMFKINYCPMCGRNLMEVK